MTITDTKQTIMDVARSMVQAHGYNALSFREIAKEVGVKSASIHYHFPTKGDLAAALARRYTEDALAFLSEIEADSVDLRAALAKYTRIFRSALENDNRMCLAGIMTAEFDDLPLGVRTEIDRFTDVNVDWISRMLSRDNPQVDPEALGERALAIFSAIEGAQLVSRGRNDIGVFDQTIRAYVAAGLM